MNDVDKFYDHNGWWIEDFAVTRGGIIVSNDFRENY